MELIDVSENEEFVCKAIHINSVLKNENFECAARVAQLVERLTCNEDVAGSTPVSGSTCQSISWVGFPSGQREQTVNLSAKPSEVQILPPPPSSM